MKDYKEFLNDLGISVDKVIRNAPLSLLYEEAIKYEKSTYIALNGAMVASSGEKTGRSPLDKRVVDEEATTNDIWWGSVNIRLSNHAFGINKERAINYLNTRERLYIFDGFAGWSPKYRQKIRVICARAYHALFMNNMLIRPTAEELDNFGEPDFTVVNAGEFPANKYTECMASTTSIDINFKTREMVILGTQYAGEMKKGIFTVMQYIMLKQGILPLHSSANQGSDELDVTLFFGLSGTGKTTLSTDIKRKLIGDDEHCWDESGIFNIEGGCYAKCLKLSELDEPEVWNAIRFGSVLENVTIDINTRYVDYNDSSITENTRCAYPIEYVENCKIPCIATHPRNIILLTCDLFGVLPPISMLSYSQIMYHFISGYTSKVPGTEVGAIEPTPIFSACFGEPFLVMHPKYYANLLANKIQKHKSTAWLMNTGWCGGDYKMGSRIPLKYSRAIIDAIHDGSLNDVEWENFPVFNLAIPKSCKGVPSEYLNPRKLWDLNGSKNYTQALNKLTLLFTKNFEKYRNEVDENIMMGGPLLN